MRKINEIIIHCSATHEGADFSALDIDYWHRKRGFDCIGYHYVICLDGRIQKGRNIEYAGAHCYGHNQNSIGVCYIGGLDKEGFPKDTRTPAQREALKSLVNDLRDAWGDIPVHGHHYYNKKKACPCFDVEGEFT